MVFGFVWRDFRCAGAWDCDDEGSRFRSFKLNNTELRERLLCRTDFRTQPGLLTPGYDGKRIRPDGAVGTRYPRNLGINCLSPLQGEIHDADLPGVKTPGSVLKSLRDKKARRGSTKFGARSRNQFDDEDDDEDEYD